MILAYLCLVTGSMIGIFYGSDTKKISLYHSDRVDRTPSLPSLLEYGAVFASTNPPVRQDPNDAAGLISRLN